MRICFSGSFVNYFTFFQATAVAFEAVALDYTQPYGLGDVISCQFERSQVSPDERQT